MREENQTLGLATLRPDHVSVRKDVVTVEYVAKGSKERLQSIIDADVAKIIRGLRRARTDQQELLCYRAGRSWRDVKSADVNDYLREVVGIEVSAKGLPHRTRGSSTSTTTVSRSGPRWSARATTATSVRRRRTATSRPGPCHARRARPRRAQRGQARETHQSRPPALPNLGHPSRVLKGSQTGAGAYGFQGRLSTGPHLRVGGVESLVEH